jgi:hypothetical protein
MFTTHTHADKQANQKKNYNNPPLFFQVGIDEKPPTKTRDPSTKKHCTNTLRPDYLAPTISKASTFFWGAKWERANWVVPQEKRRALCRRLHLTLSENHVRDWVGRRRRLRREFSPGRGDIHYHFSGNAIRRRRRRKNRISRDAPRFSEIPKYRIPPVRAADRSR